jgi:hypothetical protein
LLGAGHKRKASNEEANSDGDFPTSDDDEAWPGTGDVAGHKRKATNEEANSDDEDADEDYVDVPAKQKQKQKSTYLALSQTTGTGTDPRFLAPVGARIVVPT